jgi:pyruvate,water dikinase
MLRWLSELSDKDGATVGPKIARLGTLRESGVEVPDGFAITADAFQTFLAANGLTDIIDRELTSANDVDNLAQLEAASGRIRKLVEAAPLEAGFEAALREAYDELCFRHGDVMLPVAVRSSATGEDAASASFAGQYESYLGVIGADALLVAVRQAWSSLFVTRALAYRLCHKQHYRETPMGVGVLRLVLARCAGVAFSAHPVSKNRVDGRILAYRVGDKRIASVFDRVRGGVTEQQLPARFRRAQCLTPDMVQGLWSTISQIERRFGACVDIEWVIEPNWRPGDPITVVQVRPISTLDNEASVSAPPKWDALGYAAKYGLGIKPKSTAAS